MKLLRIALPIGILGVGVFAFGLLVAMKPEAKKKPRQETGTVVEVVIAKRTSERIWVEARGTVMAAREVALGAEVGGRVVDSDPRLVPGGRFAAGEMILRVDPTDYRLALEQQSAAVDSAQTALEIEEGRKRIAEREWELFEKKKEQTSTLALREPQLRTAKVQLKAARSGLKKARLNVSRTQIRAPFNGTVVRRSVELGQMVAPGAPLISFVGLDKYHVQVSVPFEKLSWIAVPGVRGATGGARAVIRQRVRDSEDVVREGRVLRLLSDVDPAGRMARLLVEIDDPLGLLPREATVASEGGVTESQLPMLLGSFVRIQLEGDDVADVFEIPRSSLREGKYVYLKRGDALAISEVDILWRREETVLLSSGVESGDSIITSAVPSAVEGLRIRLAPETPVVPERAAEAQPPKKSGREGKPTASETTAGKTTN